MYIELREITGLYSHCMYILGLAHTYNIHTYNLLGFKYVPVSTALVTQPMLQRRPNPTELRLMDSYIQILCRFQKCKRKVPPPSPLYNDFEKKRFFQKF